MAIYVKNSDCYRRYAIFAWFNKRFVAMVKQLRGMSYVQQNSVSAVFHIVYFEGEI